MPLTLLLNWRLWAAGIVLLALAASHWKAYHMGMTEVRAEWTEQQIKDRDAAAERARLWNEQIAKEREDAAKREQKLRRDADGARAALVGLSGAVDEAMRAAGASHEACLVTAATGTKLLQQCGDRYRGLAEIADRHASDVQTLSNSWPQN